MMGVSPPEGTSPTTGLSPPTGASPPTGLAPPTWKKMERAGSPEKNYITEDQYQSVPFYEMIPESVEKVQGTCIQDSDVWHHKDSEYTFHSMSSFYEQRRKRREMYDNDDYNCEYSILDDSTNGIMIFCSTVHKFNDFKKQLVKDTGFGGMLEVPALKKIDYKLDNAEGIVIPPCKPEIGKYFLECLNESLFPGQHNSQSVPDVSDVEKFLLSEINQHSPKQAINAFKICFVIYAMSMVLCQCDFKAKAKLDYWAALINAEDISKYNWSAFVFNWMFESIETSQNIFSLFLQIIYLDNIEIGNLKFSHNSMPRVKLFSFEKTQQMIDADKIYYGDIHVRSLSEFGLSKLRDRSEVCYGRHDVEEDQSIKRRRSGAEEAIEWIQNLKPGKYDY
ncbi:hypothetical protein ACP70R_024929 [Stipagrostis hirtigluma subsp. patula]